MTALTVSRRRKHRRGNRSPRITRTLTAIPEDQSCREWEILSTTTTSSPSWLSSHQSQLKTTSLSELDAASTVVCYKLIDLERENHNLRALAQSEKLQQLARLHVNRMARDGQVSHTVSNIFQLQAVLQSRQAGENVQRGATPIDMHNITMEKLKINRNNLLGDFHEYGVAAARGRDGKLYLCQLFR